MTPKTPELDAFADAYRAAALAGADMHQVVDAIESMREGIRVHGYSPAALRTVNDRVGAAWSRPEQEALAQLRATVLARYAAHHEDRIRSAAARDCEAGWRLLVATYATTITREEPVVYDRLTALVDALPPSPGDDAALIRTATRHLVADRWVEVYPALLRLLEHDAVEHGDRGRLGATAALIQLYRLLDFDRAAALLASARSSAPDDPQVLAAQGDYHVVVDEDLDAATAMFRAALAADDYSGAGYVGMGDVHRQRDDLQAASSWYHEAVEREPGSTAGRFALLRHYGTPGVELPDPDPIPDLVDQVAFVKPNDTYSALLEAAAVYERRSAMRDAEAWRRRAVEHSPDQPEGHTSLGYARLAEQDRDGARRAFEQAISVAPELSDGHLAMGVWSEVLARSADERVHWEQAEAHYLEAARHQPVPSRLLGAQAAYASWRAGNHDDARARMLANVGTRADRQVVRPDGVVRIAEELGDDIQHRLGDPDGAWDFYRRLHDRLGPSYEDRYRHRVALLRNTLGNQCYGADEHAAAREHYQEAIDLDVTEPVYWSNLSLALEHDQSLELVERYRRAAEALGRAGAQDPDDAEYRWRAERCRALERYGAALGSAALTRHPVVNAVTLDVGQRLVSLFEGHDGGLTPEAQERIEALRSAVDRDYGVAVPGVRVRAAEELDALIYVISVMDVPVANGVVDQDSSRALPLGDRPQQLSGETDPESDASTAPAAEPPATSGGRLDYILAHLKRVLEGLLSEFVGVQQISALLRQTDEALWRQVVETGALVGLTIALRALVAERVPITAFREIVGAYLDLRASQLDGVTIIERIRQLPEVRARLPGSDGQTRLIAVDDDLQRTVAAAVHTSGDGTRVLAMEPDVCQHVLRSLREAAAGNNACFVVGDSAVRPFVRSLVAMELPDLPVLSAGELRTGDTERSAVGHAAAGGELATGAS